MKTEQEFSDFFVESCQHENKFNDYVNSIAKNYWLDLTAHLNTYFTNDDRLQITKKAAELLSENLNTMPQEEAWPSVIRDFIQNNWGFQSVIKKPKKNKQKIKKSSGKFLNMFGHLFSRCLSSKLLCIFLELKPQTIQRK